MRVLSRPILACFAIIIAFGSGVDQGALAQNAQPVPIQVAVQPNGAQLIFIWPDSVDYEAQIQGRTLRVRFERPLMPRFSEVLTKLANIVETAGVTDGGRTVGFQLTGDYVLDHRREGNGVVIVLTAAAVEPVTAPTPAQVAVDVAPPDDLAALPAPLLAIQFGSHEDFGRAIFDWDQEVAYRVEREGDRVVVRFDTVARIGPLSAEDLPSTITAMGAVASDGGLAVALDIVPNARLRDYRSGLKIVLDVMVPEDAPADAAEQVVEVAAAVPDPVAAVPPAAPPVTPPVETPAVTPAPAAQPAAPGWAAADAGEPPADSVAVAEPVRTVVRTVVKPGQVVPIDKRVAPQPEPEPARETMVDEDVDEEDVAEDGGEAVGEDDTLPDVEPVEIEVTDQGPTVLVGFDAKTNGLELEFPWPIEVGAAIFRRAGYLWVLFDSPAMFSFRLLAEDMPVIAAAEQVPVPGRALARFRLSGQYKPRVRVENGTWIVSLGASGGPSDPIEVVGQYSADVGAHLMVLDEAPGAEVVIVDPEVGDQLFIVPLTTVGRGVAPARRMIDLEMLETAQGVVVRPIADTVTVRSLRDGVEITNLAGLNIGSVTDSDAEGDEPGLLTPPPAMTAPALPLNTGTGSQFAEEDFLTDDERLFEFAAWNGDPDDGFLARKHAFNLALGASDSEQRGDARLDLAHFHFANGQAAETLGWIERALLDAPWLDQDINIRALRGAANFLLGRSEEAQADLFDS